MPPHHPLPTPQRQPGYDWTAMKLNLTRQAMIALVAPMKSHSMHSQLCSTVALAFLAVCLEIVRCRSQPINTAGMSEEQRIAAAVQQASAQHLAQVGTYEYVFNQPKSSKCSSVDCTLRSAFVVIARSNFISLLGNRTWPSHIVVCGTGSPHVRAKKKKSTGSLPAIVGRLLLGQQVPLVCASL